MTMGQLGMKHPSLAGMVTAIEARIIEHRLSELLRQWIFGLALGYEDLNDHDRLRVDPVHAVPAGKKDVTGEHRAHKADRGNALAAHSTLNRMELGAEHLDGRCVPRQRTHAMW